MLNDASCEVVVIGGGITGALILWELVDAGVNCLMIEQSAKHWPGFESGNRRGIQDLPAAAADHRLNEEDGFNIQPHRGQIFLDRKCPPVPAESLAGIDYQDVDPDSAFLQLLEDLPCRVGMLQVLCDDVTCYVVVRLKLLGGGAELRHNGRYQDQWMAMTRIRGRDQSLCYLNSR